MKCYCQAQSQLQVKLSLKTELALISLNPATPTPTRPGKFISQHLAVNVDKVTLVVVVVGPKLEDDPNYFEMEDDLNFLENGRRPKIFGKWKMTSI